MCSWKRLRGCFRLLQGPGMPLMDCFSTREGVAGIMNGLLKLTTMNDLCLLDNATTKQT
jgi:hypothetical protein